MKNIKNKYLLALFLAVLVIGLTFSPVAPVVGAASIVTASPTASECTVSSGLSIPAPCPGYSCTGKSPQDCLKQNPITLWAVFAINLVSVVIVIGASAMLVYAGIEYISAADNPERVKKAKQKITNVIMGIVAFFFLYAFLQWLIPGGAF